ncbi:MULTISPECIES: peptide deformylase [Halobacteriovorax]|uniref:Peptide deformylase n=1 Tax=Halobacteriovorax vibrionivorans TaxID=2152716 RepID=A0ABY0IKD9_9BACT|nr:MULTISPECIES: peptide deformylase [Halobacteriovorax]AYF45999.1 peptide deformylase [Halobacteriovorax sp. BALOs_7]RZF23025.1 peptide deformylase [Halobacteriovorax vibrionivorans]TGD48803.1 peptide deformylase [Halobacteriovorax sp. Y22]
MNTTEEFLKDYTLEGEKLEIFTYPAPILKKVAEPVTEFNDSLKKLAKDMLYTMYHAPGIGLAAPQIGVSDRIFVMDIDFERKEVTRADGTRDYDISNFNPRIFINPKIEKTAGDIVYEEGCLSVPGIYEEVKRAEAIKVTYQDLDGNEQILEADGLLSVCIQHENDHLDGIVFLERLSTLKRNFLTKRYMKRVKGR